MIREKLKTVQDRQKSYVDNKSKDLEFAVGDWVFLKLSLWNGVMWFGKHGKLSSRYIESYEIMECIKLVALPYLQNYLEFMMYSIYPRYISMCPILPIFWINNQWS
ncbi:hypothetical protein L3X38_011741 [Prunus dulcis]|uniref:Tf2-1-like SH3-like domain-containing protein n=1 Tax=Prunus dulcis TaxID=3755 RepID=A0AAD4WHZ8_PRUDU|nr:hypothetical protein L3X38_011741 [Prunus dulcis]